MSTPAGTLSVSEAADEEALAADRKNMSQKVNGTTNPDVQVVDAAHKLASTHLNTPGLSTSTVVTPDSETELHSPPHHQPKPPTTSGLHPLSALAENVTADEVSLNETPDARYTSQSMAPSAGSRAGESAGGFHGSKSVSDQAFPFPNVRPISSSNSPGPQGMKIPPISGSSSAVMSRNPSGHSVSGHFGKSTKPLKTPTAEMKGFFQKMFHSDKDKNHDKEKEREGRQQPHLDIPKDRQSGSGFASGHSSPRGSPGPHSRDRSPPASPGLPSDSDHSRPPSRATSYSRRGSGSRPETPPVPAPSLARKYSGKSGKAEKPAKPVATVNGQPVVVGQKQEVVAASGNKFTLKDLIGLGGSDPKLNRKQSGSNKGSDRGSTKGGSERGDDNGSTASLLKKYGVCDKAAIGKGATAVVRLAHKWDRREEKLYAVKEFRKRRKNETEKDYVKKLTSEFCISSTLHHPNIVETVDLVQDEAQHWCEVMEYCPGGDLYAAIKKGGMSSGEVECSFKQVLLGIQYLHSMGVAHRDIKPENLLLDGRGHVKITDFGVSDVFRMCWEKKTHLSKGLCGSEPYIAPELFDQKEYDARQVDVWAAAVVFYCMQFQELPWRVAKNTDPTYNTYRSQYTLGTAESPSATPAPLNNLVPRECRGVIKHMLDPDPKTRWSIDDALADKWMMGIKVCKEGELADHAHTTAGLEIVKGV